MQTSSRDLPAPNFFFTESQASDKNERVKDRQNPNNTRADCENKQDAVDDDNSVPNIDTASCDDVYDGDEPDNNYVINDEDDYNDDDNNNCADEEVDVEIIKNNYINNNNCDEVWSYPLVRTTFLFESEKCTHIFTNNSIQLRSGDEAESVISICDLCGFKKINN